MNDNSEYRKGFKDGAACATCASMFAFLLLLSLAGCGAPHLAAPTSVSSVLGPVPVVYVDTIPAMDSTRYLVGGFDYYARQVLIRREALRSAITAHLIAAHEECHIVLVDAGVRLDPYMVELVCDAFAQAKVAALVKRYP